MNILTLLLCDRFLKTGQPAPERFGNEFRCGNEKPPERDEIDQCLGLMRRGELRLHHFTGSGARDASWSEGGFDISVRAPAMIDTKFIDTINRLPGDMLFGEFKYDTECCYISLNRVFKVENRAGIVIRHPFRAEGFSDGGEIRAYQDGNALVKDLFWRTIPDDPLEEEYGSYAHPFHALFHGYEVGPFTLLHLAASEGRLGELPDDKLRGTDKFLDIDEEPVLIRNELRDTALHIAAETGEIMTLPMDLVTPRNLFVPGNRGRTVIEVACEAGLERWVVQHLTRFPESEWRNVYIRRPENVRSALPESVLQIPQVSNLIEMQR